MAFNKNEKYPKAVKQVIKDYGTQIVREPHRFYALLSDFRAFDDCAVGVQQITKTLCDSTEFTILLDYKEASIKKTELRRLYRRWAKKYNFNRDKVKYATYGIVYALDITIDYESKDNVKQTHKTKSHKERHHKKRGKNVANQDKKKLIPAAIILLPIAFFIAYATGLNFALFILIYIVLFVTTIIFAKYFHQYFAPLIKTLKK